MDLIVLEPVIVEGYKVGILRVFYVDFPCSQTLTACFSLNSRCSNWLNQERRWYGNPHHHHRQLRHVSIFRSFSYISVDWIWSSCNFLVQFSSRPELCVAMYWKQNHGLSMVCIAVWGRSCGRVVHKFLTWWGASGYFMFCPSLVLLSSSASVITWQVNSDPGSSIIWYCQVVPSATTSMTERSDISKTCVPNYFHRGSFKNLPILFVKTGRKCGIQAWIWNDWT